MAMPWAESSSAEIDEILPLDEAAHRRRRGYDQQRVAGVRVHQPMQLACIGQGHHDIGQRRVGDVAQHHQRLRRILHLLGESKRPGRALAAIVAAQRMQQRAIEADADRLPLFQRQPADIADDRPAFGADRLDVERFL